MLTVFVDHIIVTLFYKNANMKSSEMEMGSALLASKSQWRQKLGVVIDGVDKTKSINSFVEKRVLKPTITK